MAACQQVTERCAPTMLAGRFLRVSSLTVAVAARAAMMTHGLEAQNRARGANNGEAQKVHIAHMTDNIWDAGTAHSELDSVLMT